MRGGYPITFRDIFQNEPSFARFSNESGCTPLCEKSKEKKVVGIGIPTSWEDGLKHSFKGSPESNRAYSQNGDRIRYVRSKHAVVRGRGSRNRFA